MPAQGWEVFDGFNPTLVRLRLSGIPIQARGGKQFQSHAGSIEATSPLLSREPFRFVSIPRWFD